MKVYILSDYEEHGARNVVGTTDPNKLPALLVEHFGQSEHELVRLSYVLDTYETSEDGENLSKGWGGVMLHIIELK